jgi:hypothetical protein
VAARIAFIQTAVPSVYPAVAGVTLHSGWAIVVSVARDAGGFRVVDRRRFTLAPRDLPSQPYHHEALELDLADGEALVLKVRHAVSEQACRELRALRDDLAPSFGLVAAAFRESRPIPAAFPQVLATRAVYIADAEIYRDAMHHAAGELGVKVFSFPKSQEFEFGAPAVDTDAAGLADRIRSWRRTLGPPWQKDHHAAAAAAIGALARATVSG